MGQQILSSTTQSPISPGSSLLFSIITIRNIILRILPNLKKSKLKIKNYNSKQTSLWKTPPPVTSAHFRPPSILFKRTRPPVSTFTLQYHAIYGKISPVTSSQIIFSPPLIHLTTLNPLISKTLLRTPSHTFNSYACGVNTYVRLRNVR